MTDSREYILNNIQAALGEALLPDATPERPALDVPRTSGGLEQFVQEAELLSVQVVRVETPGRAVEAVSDLFKTRGWKQVLAWDWEQIGCEGLAGMFEVAGVEVFHTGRPADLAAIPVGLTGAEAALADTGTIIVRNGRGRSPLASLLPPVHVALLDGARIFPEMRAFFESLEPQGGIGPHTRETSNLVFISGPSRTADIEQTLTLGVHGPRELVLVVWG